MKEQTYLNEALKKIASLTELTQDPLKRAEIDATARVIYLLGQASGVQAYLDLQKCKEGRQ